MKSLINSWVPVRNMILQIQFGKGTTWSGSQSEPRMSNGSPAPALRSVTGAYRMAGPGLSKTQPVSRQPRNTLATPCQSTGQRCLRHRWRRAASRSQRAPALLAGTRSSGTCRNGDGCYNGRTWTSSKWTCAPLAWDLQILLASTTATGRDLLSLITHHFDRHFFASARGCPTPTSTSP